MANVVLPDRSDEDAALYDDLTGLPGRMLQRAHLVHALRRADRNHTRVAVLFLDVEDFDDLNHRLGRELADQVLVTLAARIQCALRGTDVTARLDADEFAIVCEEVSDTREVATLVRRINAAATATMSIGDHVVELRVTTGSALSEGGEGAGQLLNLANRDMLDRRTS
jgi:diguanylate cyclase (GGDEF)-like protein